MTMFRSTHPATVQMNQVSLSLLAELDAWIDAIRRRRIRRSYGRLSNAQLRDIGLTAHDLEVALAQPVERSADTALAKAAVADGAMW